MKEMDTGMLKAKPHEDYPVEEGRYIRGNAYSPVKNRQEKPL